VTQLRFDTARRGQHPVEADTGLDAEAVQHIEQILGRQVPGGARSVRAAAEAAGGGIERGDAEIQRGEHVRQGSAARVVEVEREAIERDARGDGVDDEGNLARVGDADGVAHRDLVCAHVEQRGGYVGHRGGGDGSFERAAECGGDVGAHRQLRLGRPRTHGAIRLERLGDRLVDVAPAERVGRGREDRHFVGTRLDGAREPGQVGHERGVARPGTADNPGEHLAGVGHLRHPLRAHECRDLDDGVTRVAQRVDEGDLVGGADRRRLVLEAVAGADFDDRDARGTLTQDR